MMTSKEKINGWTFEETIKTAENLMEAESNMFKWDVLRHLRDFLENYKDELEQYRAIGTIEEFKALKEKSVAKKVIYVSNKGVKTPHCPNCNMELTMYRYRRKSCNCGQKLDWQ